MWIAFEAWAQSTKLVGTVKTTLLENFSHAFECAGMFMAFQEIKGLHSPIGKPAICYANFLLYLSIRAINRLSIIPYYSSLDSQMAD
jgi:hypothetical protein